ncbi:MAG: DUF1552 domain-containing protein [Deltaproteobacteria bacterium]|nr:DUF1552 domain-containing protein [Deltaproteobacteria bacterium]MCW5805120.1 DUF1552 domain-containing protein [Deltaproteobacteria bacterium]
MPSLKLSRRNFLRGVAGGATAVVALPALEAMLDAHGEAHSDGSPIARRFVCFHFGNGYTLSRLVPATEGPDYQLTVLLTPLANVKAHVNVLTGFANKHADRITHHEGMAGMWSAHPFIHQGGLNSKFGGPSIDQVVAARLGNATVFPSLELGCSKRVSTDEGPTMQFMSHKGPDQPMPPEYNPRAVFARLFAQPPPDDPSRPSRVNALDAVLEDARALKAKIGAADRVRLDAHLESVARLQAQISALPPVCVKPAMPAADNVDVGGLEPMEDVARAMLDLMVYAFACDLTRVSSFMLSGGVGHTIYHFLGTLAEQHVLSHDPTGSAVPLNRSIKWNIEQYAYLLEKMQATPDGAKTLLDNSVVILGSDCSEGWSHAIDNMPVLVGGGGGGMLKSPGIHTRSKNDRNLSDILLTCMRTVVPDLESVGAAEMRSTTVVSEILR